MQLLLLLGRSGHEFLDFESLSSALESTLDKVSTNCVIAESFTSDFMALLEHF